MASSTSQAAAVGVVENGNTAALVTIGGGKILDRRRIELTPGEMPTHPHHHEGSWAVGRYLSTPGARAGSLADAVALVERVAVAAGVGARTELALEREKIDAVISAMGRSIGPPWQAQHKLAAAAALAAQASERASPP